MLGSPSPLLLIVHEGLYVAGILLVSVNLVGFHRSVLLLLKGVGLLGRDQRVLFVFILVNFVDALELQNLFLLGSSFTYFRSDPSGARNMLDRFFISIEVGGWNHNVS